MGRSAIAWSLGTVRVFLSWAFGVGGAGRGLGWRLGLGWGTGRSEVWKADEADQPRLASPPIFVIVLRSYYKAQDEGVMAQSQSPSESHNFEF